MHESLCQSSSDGESARRKIASAQKCPELVPTSNVYAAHMHTRTHGTSCQLQYGILRDLEHFKLFQKQYENYALRTRTREWFSLERARHAAEQYTPLALLVLHETTFR
ncbi:hypothetical protein BaRGS_00019369 [Batillaria attramentaria]|uniref:Uncharacterized protein n=1 Tax=Batillaria attramentaria TaxID=370345 RepID=A0ABD0KQN7_9CAEN